jgi:hypothetical protein
MATLSIMCYLSINFFQKMVKDDKILKEAAAVTLGFSAVFLFNIFVQLRARIRSIGDFKEQKKEGSKEKYVRYGAQDLIASDRSVGNLVEWQGVFLSLFWTNAILTGKDIWLGWAYVGLRAIYPFVAIGMGGITESGIKPQIALVTFPAYMILLKLAFNIYNHL